MHYPDSRNATSNFTYLLLEHRNDARRNSHKRIALYFQCGISCGNLPGGIYQSFTRVITRLRECVMFFLQFSTTNFFMHRN